jgi:hypothetical protein
MPELRLLAVGDISLKTDENSNPFRGVMPVLQTGDILFGNLETVLTERTTKAQKSVSISSAPWKLKYLKEAGFDLLNLANNHILDCNSQGLKDTLEELRKQNIRSIGAGSGDYWRGSTVIDCNGISIGFWGYNQTGFSDPETGLFINGISSDAIVRDIQAMSARCDVVVVSLHWGTENVSYPSPSQIELAHSLIDAGADVILGHHPHVIQGIENYGGGLIAYSLGNFQFQYDVSGKTSDLGCRTDYSMILSLRFGKEGLISHDIIPVLIDSSYRPQLTADPIRNNILNLIDRISQPLSKEPYKWSWWFDRIANRYLGDSLKSWKVRIRRYGFRHLLKCCKWLISPFVLRCFISELKTMFFRNSEPQYSKQRTLRLNSDRMPTSNPSSVNPPKSDNKVTVNV